MAKVKTVRCDLWNYDYATSPEGILKLLALVFGGGAWGIVSASAYNAASTGPYSFFLWVAVGTWALTLASYLMNLTNHQLRQQPNVCDLAMAACFGILHLIAALVFTIYTFAYGLWPYEPAITVAVLEWITFAVYIIYGTSLITHCLLANRGEAQPQWIWDMLHAKRAAAKPSSKPEEPQFNDMNAPPIGAYGQGDGQVHGGHSEQGSHSDEGVIYEDVPMESSAPQMNYAYAPNEPESDVVKHERTSRRASEENAYLSPV